ncbi:MAG: hypothetical protein COU08_01780 [Candidatus Harrisonbacteria bacterium CG10_big_fil_rev_8_21_14_0_10_42_17]|uniref:UDP-glucose/GDP-mannose dehydrogenase family protein n=1 Tax=Candidatus Harrisonbacteria bacterium CG10_big_fil_rev_8_21_14_0_10_42_17 TaxID=1974584 RepID=A0A2M6WIH4_9BACT|nr:MAG: hypothetical protein COU08_01780 [Candidatus Harrisonbacteria bacterium CG10_big_fil_rev_8_21_14_0_10_42_17]
MKTPVGVIGVGMVGDPLAKYFEEIKGYKRGSDLFLFDTDPAKKYQDDINKAEIIFVAVPTPRNPENGMCNLSILEAAVESIPGEKIVVLKSTIVPGTTEKFQKAFPQHKFLFNPEFLTEIMAWEDMMRPFSQIVGFTEKSREEAHMVLSLLPKATFMSPWGTSTYEKTQITATEAEFIKYASNAYFARKINFANGLAKLAEKMGANYNNIRKGMAADYRIGDFHLDVTNGGYRGFGGFCLPKDTSGLMKFAKQAEVPEMHDLLMADWVFNENLLREQGLSISDVSEHFTDIDLSKKVKER